MKYNERIREIREDHALTQQKVADLLHIGQRTYSDYESGKTRIPIDNIMILATSQWITLPGQATSSNHIQRNKQATELFIKKSYCLFSFYCFFRLLSAVN